MDATPIPWDWRTNPHDPHRVTVLGADMPARQPKDANGSFVIADCYGPDKHDNARLIVRAVNCHDDLLSALESMLRNHDCLSMAKCAGKNEDRWPDAASQARAAIAKAKSEA